MNDFRKLMEVTNQLFEDNSMSSKINNVLEHLDYYGAQLSALANQVEQQGFTQPAKQLESASSHVDQAIDAGVEARDYVQATRGEEAPWDNEDYT